MTFSLNSLKDQLKTEHVIEHVVDYSKPKIIKAKSEIHSILTQEMNISIIGS